MANRELVPPISATSRIVQINVKWRAANDEQSLRTQVRGLVKNSSFSVGGHCLSFVMNAVDHDGLLRRTAKVA
jgi:hypothetical protein